MDTNRQVEQLFERYSDMVYRIAISYGNHVQMAKDIVQEVFLRVLRHSPSFQNPEHEKAWFVRVTINCCKSTLSSAWLKRVQPFAENARELSAETFCHEEEQELYETLGKLPAKYRIVLYLRYFEEYQVNEIAAMLHILPNTVSKRLARAKKMLKQELSVTDYVTVKPKAEL